MLIYFSQGLLLGGAAAVQPGPFQAYLLAHTMQNGWRGTILAAFAPLVSDGPIVLLVLFVLTRLPDTFLVGLQIAGGLFLLYLARNAFFTLRKNVPVQTAPTATKRFNMFEAALMNALGPGPYLFWATIAGPILLMSWRQSAPLGVSFLFGFYGALIGGFLGFITLFALVGRLDFRISRILGFASTIALFAFGLFQLWQGGQAVFGL
jgi:threonine/homoserine/homoserine lactone efflux protein